MFDFTTLAGILTFLAWLGSAAGSAAVAAWLYDTAAPFAPDAIETWLTDARVRDPFVRLIGAGVATLAGYLIIPAQYVAELPIASQIDAALALVVPAIVGAVSAHLAVRHGG